MAPPTPCCAVSWPGCPSVSQARRPCRVPARVQARSYRGRVSRAWLAVSWPASRHRLPSCLAPLYCDKIPSCLAPFGHNTVYVLRYNAHSLQACLSHNTLHCIAIQLPSNPTAHVAIQYPIAIQFSASPTCNTPHIAIQSTPQTVPLSQYTSPMLQYNEPTAHQNYLVTIQCLYCDTIPMLNG